MPARLTVAEAARLAGVQPATIRSWQHRRKLTPCGLDHHGRPLFYATDVRNAAHNDTPTRPRT